MSTQTSDTVKVGRELVELCRRGKNLEAVERLYDDDIVSVEAMEMPGTGREMRGKDAVRGKNQWFFDNHQIHSAQIEGPYPDGDDRFALFMTYEITPKTGPKKGRRVKMSEVGLYEVRDGRIVRENYLYTPENG